MNTMTQDAEISVHTENKLNIAHVGYSLHFVQTISKVDLLEETEVETIKNRSCRTLANLAQDPNLCKVIADTEAVTLVVTFMKVTEDKEFKKTCCRALRLFGAVDKSRKKIVEQGGIFPVTCLIKEEDTDVMECGLRALAELSVRCSAECANQIQNAASIDKVVEIVQKRDRNCKDYRFAMKIIMNLMEQPNARAVVGNAGGISCFLSLLKGEVESSGKIPFLNVLCLCCREAVNRVKIREQGVLEIFMKSLEDEGLKVLHERIISALVCFVYDEPSLNLLLSLGLIRALLDHLQRSASLPIQPNNTLTEATSHYATEIFSTQNSTKRPLQSPEKLEDSGKRRKVEEDEKIQHCCVVQSELLVSSAETDPGEESKDEVFILSNKNNKDTYRGDVVCVRKASTGKFGEKDTGREGEMFDGHKINDNLRSENPVAVTWIEGSEKFEKVTVVSSIDQKSVPEEDLLKREEKTRQHVYSLDSPTYEARYSEWSLEEFRSSIKCKQSFSPDSCSQRLDRTGSSPLYSQSFSPLSTVSYNSPDYSPRYSPLRDAYGSPLSSPSRSSVGSGSPERCLSPSVFSESNDRQQKGLSLGTDAWEYSSDEEKVDRKGTNTFFEINDTVKMSKGSHSSDQPPVSETTNSKSKTTDPHKRKSDECVKVTVTLSDKAEVGETSEQEAHEQIPNGEDSTESEQAKDNKHKKKDSKCRITQENILILLSRVSQMTDPSHHLVTEECICCLLDYVLLTDKPSPRAFRILRRLVRNPHCLESMLDILAPVYIFLKVFGNDIENFDHMGEGTSAFGENLKIGSPSDSRRSSTSEHDDSQGQIDATVGDHGACLLKDLGFVAESTFGRGTIAHILKKKAGGQRIRCVLCLPFLCRSKTSQQKTLIEDGALKALLNIMKLAVSSEMHQVATLGLHFLCHFSNLRLHLPLDVPSFPVDRAGKDSSLSLKWDSGVRSDPKEDPECLYFHVLEEHDVVFVLDDIKFTASRAVITAACPVFQAMLCGDYSESRKREISMPHVLPEAFQFMLHIFHGCGSMCRVVRQVTGAEVPFDEFLEVLSLADRYLLLTLAPYLATLARQSYLNTSSVSQLYHFCCVHNYTTLAEDCLRFVLTEDISIGTRQQIISELLSQGDLDGTLQHFYQVLRSHVLSVNLK